jgi:hypothetical protein
MQAGLDHDPPIYTSSSSGMMCVPPHPAFKLRQSLTNFFAWLAWTAILPISASHVVGMMGALHLAWLLVEMGSHELFAWAVLKP